jgi:hypothetical protein
MNDDPNFCDICCRYKVSEDHSVCCCKGIQPYALSTYPGEFRMTATHPANDDNEQWYPRLEIDPLLDQLEQAKKALEIHTGKKAPVQGYAPGIPWDMHMEAYAAYCKKYGKQDALIEGWCRGGFGTEELDMFIPGWRDEIKRRHESSRAACATLKEENDQEQTTPEETTVPEQEAIRGRLLRLVRLPAARFTHRNSSRAHGAFVLDVRDGKLVGMPGWKIVGYGKAPFANNGDHLALMLEKTEQPYEGERIWHHCARWMFEDTFSEPNSDSATAG